MSAPPIDDAELIHGPEAVEEALARLGSRITDHLAGAECLALCVLQGGIVPCGLLLPRIDAPLQLDSMHVTRYRNTTVGGRVEWRTRPGAQVAGRRVLIIDDILDEGHSLAAAREWLLAEGASEVLIAVLVEKRHERKQPDVRADFVGLEVPDRYVFGFGMDYHGWHRNLRGIFAARG